MKKKRLSCLAIGLATCFFVGLVGCKDAKTDGNTANEQQVVDAVQSAMTATKVYTGSFTFTGKTTTRFGDFTREGGTLYSFDDQTGVAYLKTWNNEADDENKESILRANTYNDGYVMQSYNNEEGVTTDSYIMEDVEYGAFANLSCWDYIESWDYVSEWALEDFSSLKKAFSEVSALIQKRIREQDAHGSFSRSVSAKSENGQYVFIVQQSQKKANSVANTSVKIYAQDGKIVKITDEQSVENQMMNRVTINEMIIDYRFDKTGYDGVTTKLDAVSEPRTKEDGEYLAGQDVNFVINGKKMEYKSVSLYVGDTVESVLGRMLPDYVVNGMNVERWYTDEACTNVFAPTKLSDFIGVDVLYTNNATVKEDCALVLYRGVSKFDCSEKLKLFYGEIYDSEWHCDVQTDNGEYHLSKTGYYNEDYDTITLNGEIVSDASFYYETGNIYVVEFIQTLTDETMLEYFIN